VVERKPLAITVDQSIALTRKWLDYCEKNHDQCRHADKEHPRLPTRVIDIGSEEREPRLHISSEEERDRFVVLSHCWGSDPNTKRLLTTHVSLDSHCAKIPFDSFPKTFQDAILITRGLNIRYLWVDSVCIVQDDPSDWAREAANMHNIYNSAVLKIGADRAANADEGCFLSAQDQLERYARLKSLTFVDPKSRKHRDLYVRKSTYLPSQRAGFCFKSIVGYPAAMKGNLGQRAWVLQEGLLCRRAIYFTHTELIWECNTTCKCECEINSAMYGVYDEYNNNIQSLKHRFLRFQQSNESDFDQEGYNLDRRRTWELIIEAYTRRQLSYPSDRLPALAGVASFTSRSSTDYLAGIWRQDLELHLLWRPSTHASHIEHSRLLDSSPTFSWASITGPIGYEYGQRDPLMLWKVIGAICTPSQPNPFGPSTGFVRIGGRIAPHIGNSNAHLFSRIITMEVPLTQQSESSARSFSANVNFDTIQDLEYFRSCMEKCIYVFAALFNPPTELDKERGEEDFSTEFIALLLKPSASHPGAWERLGFVEIQLRDRKALELTLQWEHWEEFERNLEYKEVTIV
jgi:hypothetical protein